MRGNTDRYLADAAARNVRTRSRTRADRVDAARARRTMGLVAARAAVRAARRRRRQPAADRARQSRRPTTSTSGPTPTKRRSSGWSATKRATAIAFGHLHLPYVRMWRGKLLVNVASAGLAQGRRPARLLRDLHRARGRLGGEAPPRRLRREEGCNPTDRLRDSGECRTHRHASPPPVQTIKEPRFPNASTAPADRGRRPRQAVRRASPPSTASRCASKSGEFFGFLGPNGAGKTTTINAIVGLARTSAGTIRIFGYDNERAVAAGAGARRPLAAGVQLRPLSLDPRRADLRRRLLRAARKGRRRTRRHAARALRPDVGTRTSSTRRSRAARSAGSRWRAR